MIKTHFMGLIFTNHAIDRLYERGIAQSDAWYTFSHPDGYLPGSTPGSTKYYKNYGQQRIEVVAKQNEKREWVILSCWSKMVGNGRPMFPHRENLFWALVKKLASKLWGEIKKR
ncbi:DUF4258 domain-containing protein [Candidatus Shapirobacteria bacterium]|nr:DUF4258 domain-containing protein [Candidatus Shapirobacteria bacterium]